VIDQKTEIHKMATGTWWIPSKDVPQQSRVIRISNSSLHLFWPAINIPTRFGFARSTVFNIDARLSRLFYYFQDFPMSFKGNLSLLDALDQSIAPESPDNADDPAFAYQVLGHRNGGESSTRANDLDKLQEIQRLNAGISSPSPQWHHITKLRVYS